MSDSPDGVTLAATLAGAAVIKYTCLAWMENKYRTRPYEKVGAVTELYVFPTKSLGGLRVNSAECTTTGLTYQGVTDRIKEEWSTSLDLGDEAASWMDKFLDKNGLRVHFSSPEMGKRDASNVTKLWQHYAKKGDKLAFSDYCGYMLMSATSLAELNKRLAEPVTMLNFRANIVVDGCPAFDEDSWDEIKIGKATFRNIDACTRCILVTVDPFKGVKSKDEEPLTTLKKFRLKPPYGPKPCLGIHLANDDKDVINVGDVVYARRKRN
ncbi:mitochondrial amidoxime-reducing component 1-like isoform X2 [Argopecten irradians]|uniref:mitochondrial amidoxime-reducing component 1-like isoform X2 n=1 Tax=Argopecten irradians TaxID=31199 RepID=UPI003722D42E